MGWADKLDSMLTVERDFFQGIAKDATLLNIIVNDAGIDRLLENILKITFCLMSNHYVKKDKTYNSEIDILFNPVRNGPLCTLSNKARCAYVLGLIDETIYTDISHLHKIRNIFAHGTSNMGFADAEVIKWCNKLSIAKAKKYKDANKCFQLYRKARQICNDYLIDLWENKINELTKLKSPCVEQSKESQETKHKKT